MRGRSLCGALVSAEARNWPVTEGDAVFTGVRIGHSTHHHALFSVGESRNPARSEG